MFKSNIKHIPKVQFVVSLAFHEHFIFDHNLSEIKWGPLLKRKKLFEKFFRRYETRTLNLIQTYLGDKWNEKDIEVYLFFPLSNQKFPSIAHPLLICWKNDKYLLFYILIHELVHRYMFYSEEFKKFRLDLFQDEVLVTLITDRIIKELFNYATVIRIRKSFTKIIETNNTNAIYKITKEINNKWNLGKKSVFHYLTRNSKIIEQVKNNLGIRR